MKVLCLLDSVVKPNDRWLWNYLPARADEVDFLFITPPKDRFPKWGKILLYYPTYLGLAFRALRKTRAKNYDLVVAWEGKNGFPFAVLRRLLGQRKPPLVILTFIYRGVIRHFPTLARWAMKAVSHITVTTPFEAESYRRIFSLPSDSISLCPFPWYDPKHLKNSDSPDQSDRFILASGRSYRDYETLIRAVEGLDMRVVILARRFNLAGIQLPDNVEAFDLLPLGEYQSLLRRAYFVVLPLQPLPHSAGDSLLVQSMSAAKAIVATRAPSPEAYVQQGVTGILVSAGSVEEMREAITSLWRNPERVKRMGEEARRQFEQNYTFEQVAQRIHGILTKVHHAANPT